MTSETYNGWRMSPERGVQTEAGPFVVSYHGDGRATVRSDPYEINSHRAPAGDIHLKQGTFRAVSTDLTREEDGSWTLHRLSGYRVDRYTPGLAEDLSPLFAKAWAKLVLPAVLATLEDETFLREGEANMWHRNYAHLTSSINRLRETVEKTARELESLEAARQALTRIAPEGALAEVNG